MNSIKKRSKIVVLIIAVIFIFFLANIFRIQILESEDMNDAAVSTVDVSVSPLRGEIFDRNGNPLVVNKQVNAIVFNYNVFPKGSEPEKRNKIIFELIKLFDRYSIEWNDNLPIIYKNGKLQFDKEKEAEVSYLKSKAFLDLEHYASVQNCFDALVERYSLEDYSVSQARDIASVYYSMRKTGFNSSTPYVFASDVSDDVVAAVKENSKLYVGADVQIQATREYIDGTIAPHLLGIVGQLSPDEYQEKKDEGYSMNDVIGKSGIEYTMEEQLKGIPGLKRITTDASGNVEEEYIKNPVSGDNIILTLDKDLQKVAQDALKKLIVSQHSTREAVTSGAVVVMDTRNNDILACASYPTFDISKYNEQSEQLNSDPTKPLWNRALRSTYTPGSTIKPAVAMAGLEEGIINSSTLVDCRGRYTYYEDYQPGCTKIHRHQNVVNALFNSCNIFFYETSRLLGIEKL
ncbi:MAG: penicillin-binding transpeptidase domain-containing protein, partial [Ruminococcus sp.]|nr:penicillin-binding transpeptidase domain-containing protein [Ruminococcus sp.]